MLHPMSVLFCLRSPIGYRSFVWLLCAAATSLPQALYAQPLTEADVMRLARANDAQAKVARALVAVSEARETEAGLYPNPALAWQREHLTNSEPQESEDDFSLTLPLDVSGRRAARRALARAETGSTRAALARMQSDGVTRALLVFYTALAADLLVETARRNVDRLDEAVRVLARRQAEGTSSGYEHARLEIEAELAKSELRQREAHAAVARAELRVLLALGDNRLELSGKLEPALSAPAPARDPTTRRPSVRFAKASVAEASAAAEHARSSWVPTLSVTGGFKLRRAADTSSGYIAGVGIELPLFSRGQELRAQATAEQGLATARARAVEREARLDLVKAAEEWRLAHAELGRFEAATGERLQRLERAAESGYREGQRSILELLDAERARAAVEQRRIELGLLMKRAEVLLRAARGEFE